jgi:hypothetical protein
MAIVDCSQERESFFIVPHFISLLFYVLSVLRLTQLIARARTSSSTHQLAKCQHTLKLRYGVKRKSQPLILYHFFYMRSGRIDVYNNQVCNSIEKKPIYLIVCIKRKIESYFVFDISKKNSLLGFLL